MVTGQQYPGHVLSMVKEENDYASIMQLLPGPQLRSIDQHTSWTPRQEPTTELGWGVSNWAVMLIRSDLMNLNYGALADRKRLPAVVFVPYSPGWPWTYYVVEGDFELLGVRSVKVCTTISILVGFFSSEPGRSQNKFSLLSFTQLNFYQSYK